MDERVLSNLAAAAAAGADGQISFRTDSSLNDALSDTSGSVSTAPQEGPGQHGGQPDELFLADPFERPQARFKVGDLPVSIDGAAVVSLGRSNNSSGSGGSGSELPEVARLVQVPDDVLFFLDQSLGGPRREYCILKSCERCCIGTRNRAWFHRRIRLRVWLSAACGQAITGGYLLKYIYGLLGSPLWATLGWVAIVLWTIIGALLIEGSVQMAKAVVSFPSQNAVRKCAIYPWFCLKSQHYSWGQVNVLDSQEQQNPQALLSVRVASRDFLTFLPFWSPYLGLNTWESFPATIGFGLISVVTCGSECVLWVRAGAD